MTDHRVEAAVEDVEFLLSVGESLDRALVRAGISYAAFDKYRERHPRREREGA